MNNQQAYEKAARHILAQRRVCAVKGEERSTEVDLLCLYAGPNKQACAVGCLLPRKIATALDEAKLGPWDQVLGTTSKAAMAARQHLKGVDAQLLRELQQIHDKTRTDSSLATQRNAAAKKEIREELRLLGLKFKLRTSFLEA